MKRFLTLCLMVIAVLCALPGCDGEEQIDYDMVFVNGSDAAIAEVALLFLNPWLWLTLWGPLLLLAAVCVTTLNRLEPQRRRGLFPLFFIMLGLGTVLFGGAWVLDRCSLVWRIRPQMGMASALWLIGLLTGVLTVVYAKRWLLKWHRARGRAVVCLSALCLASVMLAGTFLGGLWCVGPGEEVGTYQGRKVVQGRFSWHEVTYDLYEYHGPLVRERDSFKWSESPLLDGRP